MHQLSRRENLLKTLEHQGHFPVGIVQFTHLQVACGPRVEELIWRLSTLVLNYQLIRKKNVSSLEYGCAEDELQVFKTKCKKVALYQRWWSKQAGEIAKLGARLQNVRNKYRMPTAHENGYVGDQSIPENQAQLRSTFEKWSVFDSVSESLLGCNQLNTGLMSSRTKILERGDEILCGYRSEKSEQLRNMINSICCFNGIKE